MYFDKQMLVSRPYSKRQRKCPNSIATEITPEKEDSTDLSLFFDVSVIINEQWRRHSSWFHYSAVLVNYSRQSFPAGT